MKILDLPRHLRPREKLCSKGVAALTDCELLAIILRTGIKGKNVIELAETILRKIPSSKLIHATLSELCSIKGIDRGKASIILAAYELVSRSLQSGVGQVPVVQSPQDAFQLISDIACLKKEYFIGLYLDARNQLLARETISIGTLNASIVHPREVFEPAIRHAAASLLIVHNHPSGELEPSDEDIAITKRLIKVAEIFGVLIADHLIVSRRGYISMKESGII